MIEHDLSVYANDPYEKENLLSMTNYVNLVERHSSKKNSFLELGIGHSKTIELLADQFESLSVIDAESDLIDKYKIEYPHITFIQSYFENMDFKESTFENIGMGFILEHVEDPKMILEKYMQYLEKDGKIYISVPNAKSLHRIIAHKANLLPDIKSMSETDKRYGHLRFNTYEEWLDLFLSTGLKVIATHGLYLKPFTTLQIESLKLDTSIQIALAETASEYPEISNSCFFVLQK